MVVQYNGYTSCCFTPTSSVPQASNIGLLLFSIVMNYADAVIKHFCLFYADDDKLYKPVACLQDFAELQMDINNVFDWCTSNLDINPRKYNMMSISIKTD